jgi:hypothetical protein
MLFVELKRRGGRLSDAQEAMRDHLVACGFAYLVTSSPDEAIVWLKAHGVLRMSAAAGSDPCFIG